MPCIQAVWPLYPTEHRATCVAQAHDGAILTGGRDGTIVRFEGVRPKTDAEQHSGSTPVLQPSLQLVRHDAPVQAIVTGLAAGPTGDSHFLSVDSTGWCCLWHEATAQCVQRRQVACLLPGTDVTALPLQQGHRQVCITVSPSAQPSADERRRTLQPYTPQEVQAPLLFVLNAASLEMEAAPVVSRVGQCANVAGLRPDGRDPIVCCAATRLEVQESSGQADDVCILSVSSSGWMFCGSTAGRLYPEAWHGAASRSSSSGPLLQGSLQTDASGWRLLVVQASGWQLLRSTSRQACSGLPSAWAVVHSSRPGICQQLAAPDSSQPKAVRFSKAGQAGNTAACCSSSLADAATPVPADQDCGDGSMLPSRAGNRAASVGCESVAVPLAGGMLLNSSSSTSNCTSNSIEVSPGYVLAAWDERGTACLVRLDEQGLQISRCRLSLLQPLQPSQPLESCSIVVAAISAAPLQGSTFGLAVAAVTCFRTKNLDDICSTSAATQDPHDCSTCDTHVCTVSVSPSATDTHVQQPTGGVASCSAPVDTSHGDWSAVWCRPPSCSAVPSRKRSLAGLQQQAADTVTDASAASSTATWVDAVNGAPAKIARLAAGKGATCVTHAIECSIDSALQSSQAACSAQEQDATAVSRQTKADDGGSNTGSSSSSSNQMLVTELILLGSDQAGIKQLALCTASGTIHFFNLAAYCVPGMAAAVAAPTECSQAATAQAGGCERHVGCSSPGHLGVITCHMEVSFIRPPCSFSGPPGQHHWQDASSQSSWPPSRTTSGAFSDQDYTTPSQASSAVPSRPGSAHSMRRDTAEGPTVAAAAMAAAAAWLPRAAAADGGAAQLPLLLTGGQDGSVRGWDLRQKTLGQAYMVAHPHCGPVRQLVLPPVHARLPWSSCVLSLSEDGSIGLLSLATGQCHRVFRDFPYGMPQQVAWSVRRGMLACGAFDSQGQWHVQLWDVYSQQLDRRVSGAPAQALMQLLCHELHSSYHHHQQHHSHHHNATAHANGQQTDSHVRAGTAGAHAHHSASVRITQIHHTSGALHVMPCSRQDVLLLHVDELQLLAHLQQGNPCQPGASACTASNGGASTPAAVRAAEPVVTASVQQMQAIQALVLLHKWGLDAAVDAQLAALVLQCVVPMAGSSAGYATTLSPACTWSSSSLDALLVSAGSTMQDQRQQVPACGTALVQEAQLDSLGAMTITLPYRLVPQQQQQQQQHDDSSVMTMPRTAAIGTVPMSKEPHTESSVELDVAECTAQVEVDGGHIATCPATAERLGSLLLKCPTLLSFRLLALVALAKWLMVHSQLRLACNACSGIITLYALHLQDMPQAAGMASADLLLFGSYCWTTAAPDALRDAAQVLLAARAKPTCNTSQQGNESVGGWPTDVLQLATLAAALPHGITLAQLLQWLPKIVVAAAACLGCPDQAPPELMRVTAAALMDVLLGTAPGAPSTAAANLLAQALRSGHAQRWLSYMGKPAWLLNRLYVMTDLARTGQMDRVAVGIVAGSSSAAGPIRKATAIGAGAVCASGLALARQASLVEGGLYVSSTLAPACTDAVLGSGSSEGPIQHDACGAPDISMAGTSYNHSALGSRQSSTELPPSQVTGLAWSSSTAATDAATGNQQRHPHHRHYPPHNHHNQHHDHQAHFQGQQHHQPSHLLSERTTRRSMDNAAERQQWLQQCTELIAALALCDMSGFLEDLSQRLAGEVLDVSACFPLSISALSRLLLRRRGCQVAAPHLGHIAGLAVRMLDPSSPALRSACLQPVSTLVRDLLTKFPQVAYSSSTMQLAVGAFSLGRSKLAAEGHTAADSGMSSRQQDDHQLYEAAVAVFDMNGGKRRVLLLPLANAAPPPAEADVPVRAQPTQQLRHNSTMARAEAAMLDHWFGGASVDAASTTSNKGAASVQADTASAPVYPAPSSAAWPVISAQDASDGVTALAISPAGDAVAAFFASARMIVVWKLAVSWTQKLAHMAAGTVTLLPHCYLPLPSIWQQASMLGQNGGNQQSTNCTWTLQWHSDSHVDLHAAGHCCASVEVLLAAAGS